MKEMRIFVVVFVFASFLQVRCQLLETMEELAQLQQQLNGGGGGIGSRIGSSIRNSFVHDGLSRVTKFVVHQSASPSPEMMEVGLAMRRAPRTKAERDLYVNLMKQVAHRTPALLSKYVKEEQHKNGTKTPYIDFYALEADVIRKAMVYNRMMSARNKARQQEEERIRQHELQIAELQSNHTMNLVNALTGGSKSASNSTPIVNAANSNVNSFDGNTVTPGYTNAGTTDFFLF